MMKGQTKAGLFLILFSVIALLSNADFRKDVGDNISIMYESKTYSVPIYEEREVVIPSTCGWNESEGRETCTTESTHTEIDVVGYKDVEVRTGQQTGIMIGDHMYTEANHEDGTSYKWKVPVGDRNFAEYGKT